MARASRARDEHTADEHTPNQSSHQPPSQAAVLFSYNKSAPATRHLPAERVVYIKISCIKHAFKHPVDVRSTGESK